MFERKKKSLNKVKIAWNVCPMKIETGMIASGQAMLNYGEVDKALFEWYFIWVFVPFCMHFIGRTHVSTLTLYCRSTITQLS